MVHTWRLLVITLGVLLLASLAHAGPGTEEKPFAAGGRIRLNLSAGDYTIKAGRNDRILVAWETRPGDSARASIAVDTNAGTATVVTHGPRNGYHVVVEVPARSDIHLDVSAGDVRVTGITGNKDLGSWAGDIDVEVAEPKDYARVDVAVKAGDITAPAFGASKGGLFRSFTWSGPGQYQLRVRLTAGDLRLYTPAPRQGGVIRR